MRKVYKNLISRRADLYIILAFALIILISLFALNLYLNSKNTTVDFTLCQDDVGCAVFAANKEYMPKTKEGGYWPVQFIVEWPSMRPANYGIFAPSFATKDGDKFFLIIRVRNTSYRGKLTQMDRYGNPNSIESWLGMKRDVAQSKLLGYNVFTDDSSRFILPITYEPWQIFCNPIWEDRVCDLTYIDGEHPAIEISVLFDESLFHEKWVISKNVTSLLMNMKKVSN